MRAFLSSRVLFVFVGVMGILACGEGRAQEEARSWRAFDLSGILTRGLDARIGTFGIAEIPRLVEDMLPHDRRTQHPAELGFLSVSDSGDRGTSLRGYHDPEALEKLLSDMIPRGDGTPRGGAGQWVGKQLIARQDSAVLDRMQELLELVERYQNERVLVEVALVRPAALDTVAPGWNRGGSSPWLDGTALSKALSADRGPGHYLCRSVGFGERVFSTPARVSKHVVDHSVSQTGPYPVWVPQLGLVATGMSADVRVFSAPGRTWYRAMVYVNWTEGKRSPREFRWHRGEIELIQERSHGLTNAIAAPFDTTVLLGSLVPGPPPPGAEDEARPATLPAPESLVALLRVRREAPDRGEHTSSRFGAFDAATLLVPDQNRPRHLFLRGPPNLTDEMFGGGLSFDEPPEPPTRRQVRARIAAELEDVLEDVDARLHAGETDVFVRGSRDARHRVRTRLEELAREGSTNLRIHLWEAVLATEVVLERYSDAFVLDESRANELSSRAGRHTSCLALDGTIGAAAAVSDETYVEGVEYLAGISDEKIGEAADPTVRSVERGQSMRVSAATTPGSRLVRVKVRAHIYGDPDLSRKLRVSAAGVLHVIPADAPAGRKVEPRPEEIEVTLPTQHYHEWSEDVVIPLGRPVLLGTEPVAGTPGKSRALMVRVDRHAPWELERQ